nr:MAG TPA: hypothetical protein [Caudoviricetes sp.]
MIRAGGAIMITPDVIIIVLMTFVISCIIYALY